jgi:hypothetical protein
MRLAEWGPNSALQFFRPKFISSKMKVTQRFS